MKIYKSKLLFEVSELHNMICVRRQVKKGEKTGNLVIKGTGSRAIVLNYGKVTKDIREGAFTVEIEQRESPIYSWYANYVKYKNWSLYR